VVRDDVEVRGDEEDRCVGGAHQASHQAKDLERHVEPGGGSCVMRSLGE